MTAHTSLGGHGRVDIVESDGVCTAPARQPSASSCCLTVRRRDAVQPGAGAAAAARGAATQRTRAHLFLLDCEAQRRAAARCRRGRGGARGSNAAQQYCRCPAIKVPACPLARHPKLPGHTLPPSPSRQHSQRQETLCTTAPILNKCSFFQVGDVVERHCDDGDIVLFNRQPSLHRLSIMALRVVVMVRSSHDLLFCLCRLREAVHHGPPRRRHGALVSFPCFVYTDVCVRLSMILMARHSSLLINPPRVCPGCAGGQDSLQRRDLIRNTR